MPSFDVVSVVDMQEVDNAVNQAVIQLLKGKDLGVEMQFVNMRP